jgi:hypothetical protein
MGDDAEQSGHCALQAWGAREQDGAARGGGRRLPHGAGGMDARACPALALPKYFEGNAQIIPRRGPIKRDAVAGSL